MDEQIIRNDELKKWKSNLEELRTSLQREIEEQKEELIRLLARKDIIESIVFRNEGKSGPEEFKKNWYEPLKAQIDEKRITLSKIEERNRTKINEINAILYEINL
jgi:hypothetical protein